ncbi:LysR family transcriptional regulator (plasmid) [Tistrella mobilis]|uniref:LysR family transcriptional regulator n=1 Tax=Tistrella mobilis TaxID=171437 RepID=UPI003558866F
MDALPSSSEFGQLRAFVAVAEALSFSRAAEMLGVSSPALSQTIRGLEERVGVRLLNRTTRSVSLTEAGSVLLQRIGPSMHDLSAAVLQVQGYSAKPTGVLRVHTFRVAADLFLTPLLAPFHWAYPDIVLDITLDDEVVDTVAEGFDAAIRIGEVIEQDMIAVRLGGELRQIAVAAPDYLARAGTPSHPRELTSHPCIGWRWQGHKQPYKWEFQEDGTWFEVTVNGPVLSNSRDFAVQAAVEGLGIAFAIEQVVAPYIADGRLVPLLTQWSAPFSGFHLCYPVQRQMAPALRAFITELRMSADQATRRSYQLAAG